MADLPEISAQETAVLVIDVQNDFCHTAGALGPGKETQADMDYEKIMDDIVKAVNQFRSRGVGVIFVRTVHSKWTDAVGWKARKANQEEARICVSESWGAEFCKVSPQPGDYVLTKNRYSAFLGTNLDLLLRSTGCKNLLLMGFVANVCVESTARDGFQLNYEVYALRDCIGAPSNREYEAALFNIRKYFGMVSDSAEILARIS